MNKNMETINRKTERRNTMNGFLSAVISYTFAALAGMCFVGGVTLLSDGRRA